MEALIESMTTLEVTLVGVVIMSWVAIAVSMMSFIKVRRQEILIQENMADLKRAFDLSNNGLMGMGKKLLSIEKNMKPLNAPSKAGKESKFRHVEIPALDTTVSRYSQASNMISQGLTVAQVAAATGMSQAEINLLAMLKRPHAAAVN